jgi:hypothetical protein
VAYTKQELRTRMNNGLEQFLAVIESFSEDQMLVPTDSVGWNVRDHLIHLAVWADGIAALLRREHRWTAMGLDMEEPEDDEPDYDMLNALIIKQHRHLSPAQARDWLMAAHRRVLDAMEALQESELSLPYEQFVSPYTGTWGHPIAEYILGNTEDHYNEHTPWIRAIAQSFGGKNG